MPEIDRSRLAELLGRLGDEKDETVLAAAREASRLVAESGSGWGDLIAAAQTTGWVSNEAAAASRGVSGDKSSDEKIVDRLLARKDISETLRSDLNDFKHAIAQGTFDKIDAEYVRALARRLGA